MPQIPEAALGFLNEADPLRLTIRTMAFVDRALIDALAKILPSGDATGWARHLPMNRKLDLALGAGVLPPDAATGLAALAELRNKYAHSAQPPTLTVEMADRVLRAWGDLYPSLVREQPEPELPEDVAAESWRQLMALVQAPVELRTLRSACLAAVFVAEWARTRAEEIAQDREVGMRNRALRLYAQRRLEGLLPQVAPEQQRPGLGGNR